LHLNCELTCSDHYKYECQTLNDIKKLYIGKEGLACHQKGAIKDAESKLKLAYDPRLKGIELAEYLSAYASIQSHKILQHLKTNSMIHKALEESSSHFIIV
jgi:hypothetical protein